MRTKLILTLLAVLTLGLTGGCSTMKDLRIENPEYLIRGVDPDLQLALPLSASSLDLDFDIEVRNPNAVGLRLDRIDFDVFVNDSLVSRARSQEDVRIPANGSGDVRLSTRVDYDDLRTIFREVADAIQGDRARYELRGRAYYQTPIGVMDFPFTIYRSRR